MPFKLRNLLGLPAVYSAFVRFVDKRDYPEQYVRARPEDRVCDLGCGTGSFLAFLPAVDYVGVDISPRYIRAAEKRFGSIAKFLCRDVTALTTDALGTFDLVMANGLLHHLSDEQVTRALTVAAGLLKPGGRLVTIDGCYLPRQSLLARWMLDLDRGSFVRRREEYVRLAEQVFPCVASHVRHDLIRIPYTHIVMECSLVADALRTRPLAA